MTKTRVLVVGGKNSAVEAALRCWHAGAHVTLSYRGAELEVAADSVLLMTGYVADMRLFEMLGATLEGASQKPVLDEQTMETGVPGLYAAGTSTAGTQHGYTLFIENCHVHATRIAAALAGETPPPAPPPINLPES